MSDVSKIELGPAKINFNDTDLGSSEGGVTVEIERRTRERMTDEYGESLVDLIETGLRARVTVRLVEWTLAQLEVAFPEFGQDTTNEYLYFGGQPIGKLSTYGKVLYVRPYAASDESYDIEFKCAIPHVVGAIPFNNEDDRGVEVTFECVLDTSQSAGKMLGEIHYEEAS